MERNYATQMDAARRGIITPELAKAAEKEHRSAEWLLPYVASGRAVIPANKNHVCLDPNAVGSMLKTKINVNLGVSRDCRDYDVEMKTWKHAAVPPQADPRMPGDDRYGARLRRCDSLSARPCHAERTGFH